MRKFNSANQVNFILFDEFWFQQHQSTDFLNVLVSCSKNRREYSILQIRLDFSWEVYRNWVSVSTLTIVSNAEIQLRQALMASTCALGFDFHCCSACLVSDEHFGHLFGGAFRIWASTRCLCFHAFFCLQHALVADVTSISSLGRHRQSWRGLALAAARRLNRPLTGACLQQSCPDCPAVNGSCYSLVYCSYSTNKHLYYVGNVRCCQTLYWSTEAIYLSKQGSRSIRHLLLNFTSWLIYCYLNIT